MNDIALHIVSFNVPWPADYGGVIDVFHRVRSLHALGVRVILHCFDYGRGEQKELEKYCYKVYYYKRCMSPDRFITREPFIVSSRHSLLLLQRLSSDSLPILLEGLHSCWFLHKIRAINPNRVVLVRAHNVEHDYYYRLASSEPRFLKRFYLRMDARKLKRYEPILTLASSVLAVTQSDQRHFLDLGCKDVLLMPSSHGNDKIISLPGKGEYVLYHADLSVPENVSAAKYLLENVFTDSSFNLVLAGRNPHPLISDMVATRSWARLVPNPDEAEMNNLLLNAHVTILVTDQPTGLKLKLLNSLYGGRFCVVNPPMVAGTHLGDACEVCENADEMREKLISLFKRNFTLEDINYRNSVLGTLYDNATNARMLITRLITS